MDTEKQRQHRRDDARLAKSGNTSRALEWIGMSEARLVFRYEISDLLDLGLEVHYIVPYQCKLISDNCMNNDQWLAFVSLTFKVAGK